MKKHVNYLDTDFYLCGLRRPETPVKWEKDAELCRQCNQVSRYFFTTYERGRDKALKKLKLRANK